VEAKARLHGLSREAAMGRAVKMSDGVARGKRPKLPPPTVPKPAVDETSGRKTGRPYARPNYWASFVLFCDPD
jgi:CHAT domain-containing protein